MPRGTPRVSPPLSAQFLCWRKALGEYPVHLTRYCFSYLATYYRGGVAKGYVAENARLLQWPKPRLTTATADQHC